MRRGERGERSNRGGRSLSNEWSVSVGVEWKSQRAMWGSVPGCGAFVY